MVPTLGKENRSTICLFAPPISSRKRYLCAEMIKREERGEEIRYGKSCSSW